MRFCVMPCGVLGVICRMQMVSVRQVCVMSGLFVLAGFVVPGCFGMVAGSLGMMVSCLGVMMRCLL